MIRAVHTPTTSAAPVSAPTTRAALKSTAALTAPNAKVRFSDVRLPPPGAEILNGPNSDPLMVCNPPFGHYLRSRYTSDNLEQLASVLRQRCLTCIELTDSALVPAAPASSTSSEFGYTAVWWRDTAIIGLALDNGNSSVLATGLAANVGTNNQTARFLAGISTGHVAGDTAQMPQIKISANGTDLTVAWGHNQYDALGLGLLTMVDFSPKSSLEWLPPTMASASLVAAYLGRVGFTGLPCNGHWEESGPGGKASILTSSIGCVVHGMRSLRRWMSEVPGRAEQLDQHLRSLDGTTGLHGERLRTVSDSGALLFSYVRGDLDAAIADGTAVVRSRFINGEWFETLSDPMSRQRKSDLALSTFVLTELAAPAGDRVLSQDELVGLAHQLERDLKGPIGYRRYQNDGWLAAYNGVDGPDPKPRKDIGLDIKDRDKMIPGTSPEWTLGNGVMAHIFGKLYLETGKPELRKRATENFNRLIGTIAPDANGKLILNELFMHVREGSQFRFMGNGINLNWSRAYLDLAVDTMREVVARDHGVSA